MKTILIFLLLISSICQGQTRRIERQQDVGGVIALFTTAGLAYGITYFAQPYIFFDGNFNNSEKCAYLAAGALATAITLNRYEDVIPFEIEINNDPNPKYWDDLEVVFYMTFKKWEPHASIEYYFFENWYNIQYGIGYEFDGRIKVEPGIRLGICSSDGSGTVYFKEKFKVKDFSIVIYQRFNINSLGKYYENRIGINYKF